MLRDAKKPVDSVTPQDHGSIPSPRLLTTEVVAATMERRRIELSAGADGIREAVNALLGEGVVS